MVLFVKCLEAFWRALFLQHLDPSTKDFLFHELSKVLGRSTPLELHVFLPPKSHPLEDPTPYAGDGWLNLQKDGPQDQRGTKPSGEVVESHGWDGPFPHSKKLYTRPLYSTNIIKDAFLAQRKICFSRCLVLEVRKTPRCASWGSDCRDHKSP